MSRLLVVLRWLQRSLVAALASMAVTGSALACLCGPPMNGRSGSQQSFDEAGLVARVTKIGIEFVPSPYCGAKHRPVNCVPQEVGVYSVGEILKGSPVEVVRIRGGGQCTMQGPMSVGETAWVAVFGDAEVGYSFESCSSFKLPAEGKYDPVIETIAVYRNRLERLNEDVRKYTSYPDTLMELARFLAETNSRLEAISVLDQVLKVDPLHREANILKAKQLALGLHQDAAVDSLAPYLAAHPGDREAMYQNVIALVQLDRLDEVPADWQDFRGIHGHDFDFSHRKMNGAVFRGNQLYNTSFAGAELRHADLSGMGMVGPNDFAGADLTGAAMFDSELTLVNFRGAVLDGADLSGSRLVAADLRGASLKGANVTEAQFGKALYDDATIWPDGFDPVAAGAEKHPQSE